MKSCQRCGSERLLNVTGKTSDCCFVEYQGRGLDGYVPRGIGIGGGDYIELVLCLDCGQVQGEFPVAQEKIEEYFPA